ncbi:MAG: copper-binding protein, partial [Granulosicoccus sp.]|nr:copper-binding protein [Granulosicoccus sp.]
MMFKVADPESLKGLKKGDAINFSVDNSAGGFVITDLQSAQ